MATVADVRVHGTTHERPIDRFTRERDALVPAPPGRAFRLEAPLTGVVATDYLVTTDTNRYSVPFTLSAPEAPSSMPASVWCSLTLPAKTCERRTLLKSNGANRSPASGQRFRVRSPAAFGALSACILRYWQPTAKSATLLRKLPLTPCPRQ